MSEFDNFTKDRDEALRSLDLEKIKAYIRKYRVDWMPSPGGVVFWAGVHKARIALNTFSKEEKEVSRKWLEDFGFGADINTT